MTKEIKQRNKTLYVCGVCGFAYKQKDLAEKCEDFCTRHHQCSLEITKYAVPSRK